jgi:DNA topoisomerase I
VLCRGKTVKWRFPFTHVRQAGSSLRKTRLSFAATTARLRYVNDRRPGIVRERTDKGFVYRDPANAAIVDSDEVARIKMIGVPPAWTCVWIGPDRNGHIQATGRDARGRKQYRYHARWRSVRDES